nr:unnamed protein product [Digitaria exilis]
MTGGATVAGVVVLAALAVVAAAGRDWGTEEEDRGNGTAGRGEVTYDGRALILDGARRMLFSGDMHYPRSTPQIWPGLIAKAKKGGLDVIQTYVFWNAHEPVQGQYNFEGRYDLVKFIREIHSQGLYVSLRIGPFIESEWKYGGLPFWLRDIPNITFRSDNEPFKRHMQKFVTKIVNLMKDERLFYPQGGPIIISQIENEYKLVEAAFHSKGPPYVQWAAAMAVNLQTGSVHGSHDKPGNIILQAPISVGLSGETNKIYTYEGSSRAEWTTIDKSMHLPLIWYKTTFDTPWGNDPVTLNLSSMRKGEVWINGESIGRSM